jgi:hypothetical protein
MERYVYDYGGREISSCDPATIGSCVAVPADTAIWVTQVAESGQDDGGQLVTGPFFTNRSYPGELGPFVCARLRTRAPNGSLSEPVELCGRDATAYQLGGTLSTIACTPGGLAQDGLLLSAQLPPGDGKDTDAGSSGACALAGGPTGDSRVALLALGAVVIVAASRRRRRDTP